MNHEGILRKIRKKILNPVLAETDRINETLTTVQNQLSFRADLMMAQSDQIKQIMGSMEYQLSEQNSRFDAMKQLIEDKDKVLSEYKDKEEEQKRQHVLSMIEQRWEIIDGFHSLRFADFNFTCPICEKGFNTNSVEKIVTSCIFKGGFIERYRCPSCGCIVGPLKMFYLSDLQFDNEYKQHYSVFPEGDATEAEKLAFFKLNPQKGKIYLNYGCGVWSRALAELRNEGYDVFGYEPYSSFSTQPFIITSKDELTKMKFDGIFSNNLLEHLKSPVENFLFFKSLLRDDTCIMCHSSGCFEYLYEYTRFHLFFYTGESVQRICDRTGLEIADYYKVEHFNNTNDTVIGYVFKTRP